MEAVNSFFETPAPARFKGIWAWLLTTDHKRIGLMYLFGIIFWFLTAAVLGGLIRLELMSPGETIMTAELYNSAFTLHGVIMIFLFIIPAFPAAFGNFFLPLQIGTDDVFFPKLNLLSWYLYMAGGIIAIAALFSDGFPDTGWTFYVPFSISTQTNVSTAVFAAFVLGVASMLTGLNFITTIHRMRSPKMGWMQIPLFTWSLYATSWVQLLATPVVSITLVLVMVERYLNIGLFDPAKGGDPILYQHLFWMYSHPAVYIMILPGMGVISEIIPVFSRKSIFGYKAIVISSMMIAVAGSLVWAHHMYTSGMSDTAVFVFSLLTFVVAIPSAIKVFSWVSTLYKGAIQMTPPLLFSLCFIYLFSVGGLTGLVLGAAGTDIHVHDTHFVVAHFHFTMFGGTGFAFFAALHYWWPKMFGRMYDFKKAYIAAILITGGFVFHYVPMFILGLQGMPRRYYDYLPQYAQGNFLAGFGALFMILGILLMVFNLAVTFKGERNAPADPWGGVTLEWKTASPPPVHNFENDPEVLAYPYDFTGVTDEDQNLGNLHKGGSLNQIPSHQDESGKKLGMWLFLYTEIILFGGLFVLYAVYLTIHPADFIAGGRELNRIFGLVNTVILLISSFAVAASITAVQLNQKGRAIAALGATQVCGLIFLVNKYLEWGHKIHVGIYPNSERLLDGSAGQNIFFGLYYVITGLHGLHIIIGMSVLAVAMAFLAKDRITARRFALLENAGLYWHLVDLIWIFIFPLFYLII